MASSTPTYTIAIPNYPPLTTIYSIPPSCIPREGYDLVIRTADTKTDFFAYSTVTVYETLVQNYLTFGCKQTGFRSPGVYCPNGWTADYSNAITDYGGPGIPETSLRCAPRGFTCTVSSCTSIITTPVVATMTGVVITTTPEDPAVTTNITETRNFSTTLLPPVTVLSTAITLLYRETDLPSGFKAEEGARWAQDSLLIPPTPGPSDATISPGPAAPTVIMSSFGCFSPPIIGVLVVLGYSILVFLGMLLIRYYHQQKLRRENRAGQRRVLSRAAFWNLGVVPVVPCLLSIPIGIFAMLFGHHRDWQEYMIILWDSKDAVTTFMQVISYFERLCAATLGWSIVKDCGWLVLAAGMPAVSFVGVWNMAAAGASYLSLLGAIWTELTDRHVPRWLLFTLLMILAAAADQTGNALIASTGITNSTGSLPFIADAIPFTSIIRRNIPSKNGAPEFGQAILSSGASYPHMLRHSQSGMTAFLPVQIGAPAPSYYSGVAYYGRFDTHCQLIPVEGILSSQDDEGFWEMSLTTTSMDLSAWNFTERPERQDISIKTGASGFESRGANTTIDDVTAISSIPWRTPTFGFREAGYVREWEDPRQSVHLFGALRFLPQDRRVFRFGGFDELSFIVQTNNASQGVGQFRAGGTYKWEFHLCRAEVPYQVGTIKTSSISTETSPVIPCDPTKIRVCPTDFQYRPATFSSTSWDDNTANRFLNASDTTRNTVWSALQSFRSIKSAAPQPAVIYCRTCTSGKLASKYFAELVSSASTDAFANAFSASLLHAIAATYRAQIPFYEGVGSAEWAVPQEVILIIKPWWIWAGVGYTWLMGIIAIVVRILLLWFVGVERSGSVITVAAMVDGDDNPFKPLLGVADMHRKDDVDFDMEERPEIWRQEVRLGVLASGRYGIGRKGEVGRLRRRNGMVPVGQVDPEGGKIDGGRNGAGKTGSETTDTVQETVG